MSSSAVWALRTLRLSGEAIELITLLFFCSAVGVFCVAELPSCCHCTCFVLCAIDTVPSLDEENEINVAGIEIGIFSLESKIISFC